MINAVTCMNFKIIMLSVRVQTLLFYLYRILENTYQSIVSESRPVVVWEQELERVRKEGTRELSEVMVSQVYLPIKTY